MQRLNITGTDSAESLSPGTDPALTTEQEAIETASNAGIPPISLPPESGTLTPGEGQPAGVSVGSLIDGKTATELMDSVLPAVLVFALHKAGLQLRKTELQLTEKEKNTLAPLMQKCMDALMMNFESPFVALGVSMVVIYGGKVMEKAGVAWLDKKSAQQQHAGTVTNAHEQSKIKRVTANRRPVDKVQAIMKRTDIQTVVDPTTGSGHTFLPDNVSAFMRERKVGQLKAIRLMTRLVELGRMDKLGYKLL